MERLFFHGTDPQGRGASTRERRETAGERERKFIFGALFCNMV